MNPIIENVLFSFESLDSILIYKKYSINCITENEKKNR